MEYFYTPSSILIAICKVLETWCYLRFFPPPTCGGKERKRHCFKKLLLYMPPSILGHVSK
ncbi:MAG: hypothetical protein LBR79_01010 [Oscillospiraceae bacterium]|nr:hypothetical protein [Oscillospiraceae bacterium]